VLEKLAYDLTACPIQDTENTFVILARIPLRISVVDEGSAVYRRFMVSRCFIR